jgi:hypothetical protein
MKAEMVLQSVVGVVNNVFSRYQKERDISDNASPNM